MLEQKIWLLEREMKNAQKLPREFEIDVRCIRKANGSDELGSESILQIANKAVLYCRSLFNSRLYKLNLYVESLLCLHNIPKVMYLEYERVQ